LNRYGDANFAYDANGNLTGDGTRTFLYDVENRLIRVTVAGVQTDLSYDPLGRLYSSITGGTTTQFLYDGDRLVAEYDGSNVIQRRYVHGPGADEPVLWYEGSGLTDRRWIHGDERGSVIATSDSGGNGTEYTYGPYGEPASWSGSRFRYTGQIALPEVKLYHYKARVYDPVLGRFLQTDPIGSKDDLNLYAYVGNDAVNGTDPSGTVGRGSGWGDDEWKNFDARQQQAAKDMDKRATQLEKKGAKVGGERGQVMLDKADKLHKGAEVLRSDGTKDGYFADSVSRSEYMTKTMGSYQGAAKMVGKTLVVNKENKVWHSTENSTQQQWIVGHESLHPFGARDLAGSSGARAYIDGNAAQRASFREFAGTPNESVIPDYIMKEVYPNLYK
jgi:RHS repeat-associated protein